MKFDITEEGNLQLKIKKIMENSIIGLTPPSPPFWPKLWKILKILIILWPQKVV